MRSKPRCKSKALSALSENRKEQRDRESEKQSCGDTEFQSFRGYGDADDTHDADGTFFLSVRDAARAVGLSAKSLHHASAYNSQPFLVPL